ncbi:hypothetical protein C8Q80DRAFT_1167412 [Daedaleopsis nitida]|nr:hypothetical protein C8Q80DRAFT_1167412 [Daedaleopsis nitida]
MVSVELLDSYHIIPFDTLAAIVRMAHKYQAEEIVTAAACRLDTFFAKFSAHATLLIEICAVESRRKWNIDWLTLWKWTEHVASVKVELSHATEAVNLARFLGRPAWVPFAIFLCCVGDPLHLRNGVRREDGELERLSDEDYMRCIRAIPVIREKSYQLVHDLLVSHHTSLFSPLSSCTQKQHCQAIFKEIVSEFKEERFFPQALTDIHVRLSCWSRLPEAIRRKRSDICPACWVRLTSNGQHELYSKIWEQIAGSINVAL